MSDLKPTLPQPTEPAETPAEQTPATLPAKTTADLIKRPLLARFLGWLARPWIDLKIDLSDAEQLHSGRPVCYVLESYGLFNALILDRACKEIGLITPFAPLPGNPLGHKRAYLALSRRRNNNPLMPEKRQGKTHSDSLARLLQVHRYQPRMDVQLVPVSIFVGRAPENQSGWFSVLFSENWAFVGGFRRLLSVLLNGRDTIVRFAPSISVRESVAEDLPPERTVRKLQRLLRTHFRNIREAVIGPDLSTRRLLVDKVLASDPVQEAITTQAKRDNTKPADAWKKAHAYAWEIAADYSTPAVRSASSLLVHVWNRIFAGVLVHHLDKLKEAAPGHEVIYVPSHRSHMDYLLLSYMLYERGTVPPHIVAGINLNLPVVGSILRKGGAFFIRRSIKGNKLYSAVLSEYVAQLVSGGYSIEYFIEGGRSRTGRLLQPKGGMISMTLSAFLRQPKRPVMFQPVYIGYEKLMEGNSYLNELSGREKKKESIWAVLWNIPKVLRQNYGQVVVNFGTPIYLNDTLAQHTPEWDGKAILNQEKLPWVSSAVDSLAQQIQENINAAADVNPINLLAIGILSTPKHAIGENDLINQIALSKTLLDKLPYSDRVTVTPHTPEEIIAHAEAINVLTRIPHPLGDVLKVENEMGVLLTYFRNNVLHLFTASAWIACCFQNSRRMHHATLLQLGRNVYPFLQGELFLHWTQDQFVEHINQTLELFIQEGLLQYIDDPADGLLTRSSTTTGLTDDEIFRLRVIAHPLQQAFERYYITISVLVKNGSAALTAAELEQLCQQAAQRLSLLYAPAAPEFFDKTLFRGFIRKLRSLSLVWPDEDNKLQFDERLDGWVRDAKFILGRELRHTIERISPQATLIELPIETAPPTSTDQN